MQRRSTAEVRAEWRDLLGERGYRHGARALWLVLGSMGFLFICLGTFVVAEFNGLDLAPGSPPELISLAVFVAFQGWGVGEIIAAQFSAGEMYGLSWDRSFLLNLRVTAQFRASLAALQPDSHEGAAFRDWRDQLGTEARALRRAGYWLYGVAIALLVAGLLIGAALTPVLHVGWIAAGAGTIVFVPLWSIGMRTYWRARAAAARTLSIPSELARSLSIWTRDSFVASLEKIRASEPGTID